MCVYPCRTTDRLLDVHATEWLRNKGHSSFLPQARQPAPPTGGSLVMVSGSWGARERRGPVPPQQKAACICIPESCWPHSSCYTHIPGEREHNSVWTRDRPPRALQQVPWQRTAATGGGEQLSSLQMAGATPRRGPL